MCCKFLLKLLIKIVSIYSNRHAYEISWNEICLRIRTHLSDTQDEAAGSEDEGPAVNRERVSDRAWPGRDEAPKYYRWWTMEKSCPSSGTQCRGCNRPPWPGRCARQRTPTWLTRRKKSESPVETMSSMRGCARDEADCRRESMRHSWRGGSGRRRGDNSPSQTKTRELTTMK